MRITSLDMFAILVMFCGLHLEVSCSGASGSVGGAVKIFDGRPLMQIGKGGSGSVCLRLDGFSGYWSFDKCMEKCRSTSGCMEFMMKKTRSGPNVKGCVLFTKGCTGIGRMSALYETFKLVPCPPVEQCAKKLYDGRPVEYQKWAGKVLIHYTGYWTLTECKAKCQATPECEEFLVKNPNRNIGGSGCVLMRGATTPSGRFSTVFKVYALVACRCRTIAGPGRGRSCEFPFTYGGLTHHTCINPNKDPKGSWCVVGKNGVGSQVIGYCDENCPGVKPKNYEREADGAFYKVSNDAAAWNKAESSCAVNGAHLAVDDVASNVVLRNYHVTKTSRGVQGLWLGGSDAAKEGDWKWSDGSPVNGPLHWARGEPDNAQGDEDCMLTNYERAGQWDDAKCSRKLHYICQLRRISNGLTSSVDIRGDITWATQWEDAIALKIYNKWLASTGGEKGMKCDSLRLVVHVFGEAPLDWEELTEDAVDLAKKDDLWPPACEDIDDVKGCRQALARVMNIEDINQGFDLINKHVASLKKVQATFLSGVDTKTCKEMLFSFIHQTFHFKSHLQEAIGCMPEMPSCVAAVNKHKAIYSKNMYQSMRKGRAKSKAAKIAAAKKLGNLADHKKYPIFTRNGGVSQEPENTPQQLINFFQEAMIHGKRLMQRDVSEVDGNPAKVFELAHAPFVGGLSGSVLEIYRLLDAYAGKSYLVQGKHVKLEAVDDRLALLFVALLDLGGHHSVTETAIATHEWGLIQDVKIPFTADTDLRKTGLRCRENLAMKYQDFLVSMEKLVDKIRY